MVKRVDNSQNPNLLDNLLKNTFQNPNLIIA